MVGSLNMDESRAPRPAEAGSGKLPCGLLFDLADVLYDASMWSRWLVQLLHRLGLQTHYKAFAQLLEREFLVEAYCGRCSFWQAVENCLRSSGLSRGQIDEVLIAAQAARRRFDESRRPFPGVQATLARLAALGLPLAVVTNASVGREALYAVLDELRLGNPFQVVLSSRDAKRTLPAASLYEAAVSALDLTPRQAAYVGHDTLELDGAAAAGLQTIAFNATAMVRADVHLTRFEQLLLQVAPRHAHLLAG